MGRLLFIFVLYLFPQISVFANCELSWVKAWEKNINWLHTSAVYFGHPSLQGSNFPLVRQTLFDGDVNRITFRCDTIESKNCPKITKIKHKDNECEISHSTVRRVDGSESAMGQVIYARLSFESCFKEKFNSNIGAIVDLETLVLPDTYKLKKFQPESPQSYLVAHEIGIRSISDLKTIRYSYGGQEFDLQEMDIELVDAYKDMANNIILSLGAKIKLKDIPGACVGRCENENEKITIPVIVGKINDVWLLIGNGHIGTCSHYNDTGSLTLAEQLKVAYGLPSNYVLYDYDFDGKIDILELTPRAHLHGTKFLYYFHGGRMVNGGELCTTEPNYCRPDAGC